MRNHLHVRNGLLFLLLAPLLINAQEPVKPIVSADYLSLIHSDSLPGKKYAASDSAALHFRISRPYANQLPIRTIKTRKDVLDILPAKTTWLTIGGNYTVSAAVQSVNATPALQNQFVQGESSNGALIWEGPATNELFSYGPDIRSLIAPYNSGLATPHDNDIFRTGSMISHSISLLADIRHHSWGQPLWSLSLKAGSAAENAVMPCNRNTSGQLAISVATHRNGFSITTGYSHFSSRFSNDNSNGFLNRVYQNALLTPVSFNNAQDPVLPNGLQRSYSNQADNPWFLLKDNGHFLDRLQQTGSFSLEKKGSNFTLGAATSLDAVDENGNQFLKPGTAFFPAGLAYTRKLNNRHLSSNAFATYNLHFGYPFNSTARLNYIYNDEDTRIQYPANFYRWRRSTHDLALTFNTTYEGGDIRAGLNAGNKFYLSTTSPRPKFFLPEISGFIAPQRIFESRLQAKLAASFTSFCSEAAINHSWSAFGLTTLPPAKAFTFMPTTEPLSFDGVDPMEHKEFTTWIQLDFDQVISLHGEYSIRTTKNDDDGMLIRTDMADTRFESYELQLQINNSYTYPQKFRIANTFSFFKYTSIATRVANGFNYLPLTGFYTVFKALVRGRPVGNLVGNTLLRDGAKNILIGKDGFPLVDDRLSVIGDPTPAYTLKFSHVATWKALTIDLDWEYRKGGDVWNGTAATLDYYGRSATTAAQRNITGYIFPGRMVGGGKNNTPVNFYDPGLPVGQNRWVRYGYSGVAESYIEKGDNIRIHNLSLAYDLKIRKYLQLVKLTAWVRDIILWSVYKGGDPNRLLYDQPGSDGLDFFNLPSTKTFGLSASIQF
jgi:hypothetical protein